MSQISFVSSLAGLVARKEVAAAEYWVQQVGHSVRLESGIETMALRGVTAFVEIGPKPALVDMGQRSLPDGDQLWLPSLLPNQEWRQLLTTLGVLYRHGIEIDWHGFDRDYHRQRVALPTYPFQRQFYGVSPVPGLVHAPDNQPSTTNGPTAPKMQSGPAVMSQSPRKFVAPRTPTERQMAAFWSDMLGAEAVSIHDNFFELGGQSIMVTQVISAIRETFQIELPLQTLFEQPTLAALAEVIDTQLWAAQGIEEDEEGSFEI
ncbi:hypothetical protein KFU94_24080 [Chloroflexi bacterium TSY]|nr:hypothetical protein [Chloroflexi bacterium TSY]